MLKNEILVTPKNNHTFGESDKDRYIQTLSFYELKQINKNVHGTDIEQRS
jgi:hypothetical protein